MSAPALTILVVDDEADIATSFAELVLMQFPEARVETVPSAEAALQALERMPVDLVVTDFKMSGMTGVELLALAQQKAPAAARVLMTAFPLHSIDLRGAPPGMHLLQKPFNIDRVLTTLGQALAGRA